MARRRKGANKSDEYEQLSFFSLFDDFFIGSNEREEHEDVQSLGNDGTVSEEIKKSSEGDGRNLHEDLERDSERNGSTSNNGFHDSSKSQQNDNQNNGRETTGSLDEENITNYRIVSDDTTLTPNEKYERNIQVLEALYNDEIPLKHKQELFSKYTGWGGLPQVFDETNQEWLERRIRLKKAVTEEQYQQIKSSVLTSFYTPYEVIDGIYDILSHMGFENGTVLEPSCGNGNFFGRMPEEMMNKSALYGIELDDISGQIAKTLYPKATIQITGYEKSLIPDNYFDVSVTNVPFGRYKVHDLDYNKYNLDIHNYFFAKSIDKVRENGIIAFITTTATLDSASSESIREIIDSKTNFLGAIRLPESTFKKNGANTSVVSDIIFLQKKSFDTINFNKTKNWKNISSLNSSIKMNQYFVDNPEMVFGDIDSTTNQFGNLVLTVRSNGKTFEEMFEKAKQKLPSNIYKEKEVQVFEDDGLIPIKPEYMKYRNNEFFKDGNILVRNGDNIKKIEKNVAQIEDYIDIHLEIKNIIFIQQHDNDDKKFEDSLSRLNSKYDTYVKKYGYINSKKSISLLSHDPNFFLVSALENVNPVTKEVIKSDFFFKRTIKPKEKVLLVENIEDALSLSMNYCGKIDLKYMETVYEKSEEDIKNELLEMRKVFIDPETNEIISRDDYLSGNVRKKYQIAKDNNFDGKFNVNIEALEPIIPEWITADQITVQMGATWIPNEYYEQFAAYIFEFIHWHKASFSVSYCDKTGDFIIGKWNEKFNVRICDTWGVQKIKPYKYTQPDYNGFNLFDDIINSRIPTIRDYWENDEGKIKSRVNPQRTSAARSLADKMKFEFSEWIMNDYERREVLEKIYNNRFNCYVDKEFDGQYLKFNEMNGMLQLEDYQKNAVARIIGSKSVLLSQRVGAGKTFEMVTACMEMKRMRLVNKPMIVVPNHLVDQWKNEFLFAYPNANILAATKKDFEKSKRKEFVHKIAVNDYDAIIISHSSFKLIPMSVELVVKNMRQEIADIRMGIEALNNDNDYSSSKTRHVKLLERTIKSIEANIEKLIDIPRDDGITFDQLGVDYLFLDEAHEFKNLYIYSKMRNIAGVPQVKSQKASDMFMKTQHILENGRGLCFATGTPISNTMAELYNLQKYLQPNLLKESGIYCFDGWAKNFGEVVSQLEISIDGSGFRTRQRFSKFFNIQELMSMFRQVAIIQTEGMLKKALEISKTGRKNVIPPKHIGAKPTVIEIEPSEELEDYIADVVERTEMIHDGAVTPDVDNMLKVTTDSKKASIDLRLIDEAYGYIKNSKIDKVIDTIYKVYTDYDNDKATQIVFCDSSTPSDRFNIYDEIRNGLVNYGIAKEEIAFIHEANTELQKTALFNKMKKGVVRVLIGSTAKLGAGTNVQDRLIAVHHVDVPWRASDIEQRNGRAFRQGNMFDEIYEFRYVTKKSFDAYSWQMIETKATYMTQLLEGTTSAREIEEDNSALMSYGEVKAIASGNPLIKEKMEVDNKIKTLFVEKNFFNKTKYEAERKKQTTPVEIAATEKEIKKYLPDLKSAEAIIKKYKGIDIKEWFEVEINGKYYNDMKEAGDVLFTAGKRKTGFTFQKLGRFCDFDFGLYAGALYIKGAEKSYRVWDEISQIGRVNFMRMLTEIFRIPEEYKREQIKLNSLKVNLESCEKILKQKFAKEEELQFLLSRQRELNEILDISNKTNDVLNEEELDTDILKEV